MYIIKYLKILYNTELIIISDIGLRLYNRTPTLPTASLPPPQGKSSAVIVSVLVAIKTEYF